MGVRHGMIWNEGQNQLAWSWVMHKYGGHPEAVQGVNVIILLLLHLDSIGALAYIGNKKTGCFEACDVPLACIVSILVPGPKHFLKYRKKLF